MMYDIVRHRSGLRKWLLAATLEAAHFSVLEELRLSSWPLPSVINRAVDGSRGWEMGWEIDEEDAADAVRTLTDRRLAEEVTPESLERIKRVPQSPEGVRSSSLLLPEVGEVSLTLKGSRLVVGLYEDVFREYPSSPYAMEENAGTICRIYGMSEESLAWALWEHREDVTAFEKMGPMYSIGPWRSDWWFLHRSGLAVDVNVCDKKGA